MIMTPYGRDIAIPVLVVSAAMALGSLLISTVWLAAIFFVLGAFLFVFTLNFFRDPERRTPDVHGAVISPADGKVISIGETVESEFMGGACMQVCIFMSPLNVHVNRWPVTGRVAFFRYIKGRFIAAFEDQASEQNERTLIGIESGSTRILFKQIAGYVARRIVAPVKVGDDTRRGERFGMIRFGSRVDVLMPLDADVRVTLGQHVTAGETVLAVLPD